MTIYHVKTKEEQKKLFVSALTKWENIQDEYPDWRDKKIADAEEKALKILRNTPPPLCPNCQTNMGNYRRCPNCKGTVEFNEKEKAWEYKAPEKEKAFDGDAWIKHLREKNETSPPKTEDIDF